MLVAFSISPTATSADGSVSEAVAAAVRVVKESGLPWELTSMFTNLEGEWDEVMAVVKRAVDVVAEVSPRVGLVLKADIRPGFDGQLTAKVERVNALLDERPEWPARRTSSPVDAGSAGRSRPRLIAAPAWSRRRRGRREPSVGVAVLGARSEAAVVPPMAAAGAAEGWVNNAAVFDDIDLTEDPAGVLRVVEANLAPAIVGSAVAARHFRRHHRPGAIVNVSSHQAQRAVRGALPYATAKAALEGLTRALAVDEGPHGIRVNAVALGSITTERYERHLDGLDPAGRSAVEAEMARLHPLGRVGRPDEVADVVAWLLGATSGYVSGAVIPVDGGRAAQGRDPEER